MNTIIKFLAIGGVILLCGQYLDGVTIAGGYKYALIAALVLAIANTFIRPILAVLSFPVTIVTFGLFSLVITAFMVMIMDYFVDHVQIASFWWALLFGVIVSFAGSLLDKFLGRNKRPTPTPQATNSGQFTSYEEVD
jgi:putative membrane protein